MSSNLKQQQSYLLNLNKILKKTILWEVWYKFSVLFQKGDILISIHPISDFALFHHISYGTLSHAWKM